MPNEIADSAGFTGGAMPSDDLKAVVKKVVDSNPEVVKKIVENKKSGPIMSLVGQVMQLTNRKADPVVIKHLVSELIDQKDNKK